MQKKHLTQPELKNQIVFELLLAFLTTIVAIIFTILPYKSNAQSNEVFQSNASLAEKIYLQLDANAYTLGNIVWFKCIVLNACDHVPSKLSRVLYVELITPGEIIKEKKLIKIENGIGQGFFFLDKNMEEGLYQIRAYTEWDKNFDSDFFYTEYIHVFAHKINSSTESPISNITLIKEENANRLTATFDPEMIDSLQKRKLTVIVSIDDQTETLELKSDRNDQFTLDYPVGEYSHFATIQMQTESNKRFTKTIVLNEDILDLQFFPESGEMVHGPQSRVGFKALDANGQGKEIEGEIVDENDVVINSFKSNILGMGSFLLTQADSTKKYYARLQTSEEGEVLMYPLPKVAAKGNILAVERRGDNIIFAALSNYIENDSINLALTCRGMNLYDLRLGLKDGSASVIIPIEKLPEGIIACTMKDRNKQPVAERLYFVEKPQSRINLDLSTDKAQYKKREETKLDIQASNSIGDPINANLSVLVINKKQLGEIQSTRQNILSYFLLESELKGRIENPGYYFGSDTSRQTDLDALMLTQGWRKYHYSKKYEELNYKAERSLNIKGYVGDYFFENIRKRAELTLMTLGKEDNSVYKQSTDDKGNFIFNLYDASGDPVNAVIQSSKKSGRNADFTITLKRHKSPEIEFEHKKTAEKLDSVFRVLAKTNMERSKVDETFPLDSGNILIDEVEVKAFKLTPERKKVIEEYGEPDIIMDGKELLAREENWSYGLGSIFQYDQDYINLKRELGSFILYLVDGVPVRREDFKLIETFPISEIESYEITKNPKDLLKCITEYFGTLPLPDPELIKEMKELDRLTGEPRRRFLTIGDINKVGVIAIYTHGSQGLLAQRARGIMTTTIPVFSAPREFYSPKYDNIKEDEWQRPDLRALIHWAPEIKTDSEGKATLSFYNADYSGDMMVVVEAVTPNGQIGYKELIYNVEGVEREILIVN